MVGDWRGLRHVWRENPLRSALGKRILVWLLLLSLVPLFASSSLGYFVSSRIIEGLATRDLEVLTAIQAHHVRDEIERLMLGLSLAVRNDRLLMASAEALRDTAADPVTLSGTSTLAAEELARLQRQLQDFTSLELVAPSGVVVAGSQRFGSGTVRLHREARERVIVEGQTFGVELVGVPPAPRLVFVVALTALDTLRPVMVAGTIEAAAIAPALQLPPFFSGGIEGFVVDDEGRPVFVSQPHSSIDYSRPISSFRAVGRGASRYRNADQRDVVGSAYHVPGYPLHFISEVPVWTALGGLRTLRFISALLGLAFVLVVISVAWVVSHGVVRPVYELVRATERIGQGDLAASVDATQRDELGLLGHRFNDMALQLRDSAARIRDYHNEEMRRADQLATVGELAAGIAHELKSPLLAIAGGVQLLSRRLEGADTEGRRLVEETLQRIVRMEGTVQGLLNYARPTPTRMASLDLNAVVERAVQLVVPRADRSGVEIRRHLATSLPAVLIDPEQIGQVVVNLALNAIEAMGGGGWLEIATRQGAEVVEMVMTDSGPGVAVEERERIFRPFHTTKHSGTGLGLAIVRQIVERHGGQVALRSPAHGGAQFVVALPIDGPAMPSEGVR